MLRFGCLAPVTVCCLVGIIQPVGGEVTEVRLIGIEFVPPDALLTLGDTVRWVWVDGPHNVESGVIVEGQGVHDGNFRSGDPIDDPETTFEVVFDQAFLDEHPMQNNRYPYYCVVHADVDMSGFVRVNMPGNSRPVPNIFHSSLRGPAPHQMIFNAINSFDPDGADIWVTWIWGDGSPNERSRQ